MTRSCRLKRSDFGPEQADRHDRVQDPRGAAPLQLALTHSQVGNVR